MGGVHYYLVVCRSNGIVENLTQIPATASLIIYTVCPVAGDRVLIPTLPARAKFLSHKVMSQRPSFQSPHLIAAVVRRRLRLRRQGVREACTTSPPTHALRQALSKARGARLVVPWEKSAVMSRARYVGTHSFA